MDQIKYEYAKHETACGGNMAWSHEPQAQKQRGPYARVLRSEMLTASILSTSLRSPVQPLTPRGLRSYQFKRLGRVLESSAKV